MGPEATPHGHAGDVGAPNPGSPASPGLAERYPGRAEAGLGDGVGVGDRCRGSQWGLPGQHRRAGGLAPGLDPSWLGGPVSLGLAVDPGYACLGVCVADEVRSGARVQVVETFRTSPSMAAGARLDAIAIRLLDLANEWDLDWIAYEDQAGATVGRFENAASRRVHEVTGLVRMLARFQRVPLLVLDPKTVKKEVAGHGHAKKGDVKECVKQLMGVAGRMSEHAADACAVWLAASRRMRLPAKVRGPLRLVTTNDSC